MLNILFINLIIEIYFNKLLAIKLFKYYKYFFYFKLKCHLLIIF